MKHISPAHNIDMVTSPESPLSYPYLLLTTSTNDDRVHPYHSRVFVHRAQARQRFAGALTPNRVLYYENIEGGHAGAADNTGVAFMNVSSLCGTCCTFVNDFNVALNSLFLRFLVQALYLTFLWKVVESDI
jgi:prolyl oligopeptidase PreP (S9A serine peptidase family)